MLHIKTEIDGKIRNVDIYGDEIFTFCYNCGKEIQVDDELLRIILDDGCDISSTSISCCKADKPTLHRIK